MWGGESEKHGVRRVRSVGRKSEECEVVRSNMCGE